MNKQQDMEKDKDLFFAANKNALDAYKGYE